MDNNTRSFAQKTGRGMKKFFTIFIIILLLGGGIYFYWKYYFTYSSGNRYGLLQKFSHKGNLFKTYEGELILSCRERRSLSFTSAFTNALKEKEWDYTSSKSRSNICGAR